MIIFFVMVLGYAMVSELSMDSRYNHESDRRHGYERSDSVDDASDVCSCRSSGEVTHEQKN